ncbi:MAG TPA: hypothetical protein VFA21_22890 [Pyrinomonadaceae bacterium]|nr:hypothetical protein [Pyrinomonadaceae bacterium]
MEELPREDEFTDFEAFSSVSATAEAGKPLRRFAADELVACEKCSRANAPTRVNCLYCGAPLPVTELSATLRRPALKNLEEWEQGFSVVFVPRGGVEPSPEDISEAASLLRLEAERLAEIVAARRALPLVRAASEEDAALFVGRLGALGIKSEIFSDEILEKQPERVRALALNEDALVCWTSPEEEPRRVGWAEVALLVAGRVVTRRVEVEQRQAKLGSRGRVVDTRELTADESVLDFYAQTGDGFRVMADGFDYSCLGAGKRLLARENFGVLVHALRERAPSAIFDEEYTGLRALLSAAWPPSERTGSGLRRDRPGRLNTESVTTVSNETQFTRYARLRLRLALRARAKES